MTPAPITTESVFARLTPEPTALGVPVSAERLDWLESVAIACAAKGITVAQFYKVGRQVVK